MYECLNVLNNFCFHVYAQNLLSHFLTLILSHSHSFSLSHSFNLSFNHSRHAEQVLFSSICSKVAIYMWKWQWVFLDIVTLSCGFRVHWAGSQLKNVWMSDKSWEPDLTLSLSQSLIHSLLSYWTTFVFMSRLKSHCFYVKITFFSWEPAQWTLNSQDDADENISESQTGAGNLKTQLGPSRQFPLAASCLIYYGVGLQHNLHPWGKFLTWKTRVCVGGGCIPPFPVQDEYIRAQSE